MNNLDKIHEYVKESTMILIINNNSKSLLDALFNSIYNKYNSKKIRIDSGKKLFFKLMNLKDKLIRIEYDLSKIQFTSSNNNNRLDSEFFLLKTYLSDNNSKLLIKTNLSNYKEITDVTKFFYNQRKYNIFDLVILIDKNSIKILKNENDPCNVYKFNKEENGVFNLEPLLRHTKLTQIQNRLKIYEKES